MFYDTSEILQKNKQETRKINLFNAISKTFKDVMVVHSKHLLPCQRKSFV